MTFVPEIIQIAADTGVSLARTAQSYFGVTQNLRIARLLAAAERVSATEQYEAMALSRSINDIATARKDITIAALTDKKDERNPVAAWRDSDNSRISRVTDQLTQLTEKGETTLAKITVAAGLLSDLAQNRMR